MTVVQIEKEKVEVKKKELDINTKQQLIIKSIMTVESQNGLYMYNAAEDAVGYLQIRPIMVKEVNRLAGYEKFTLEDRWSKEKSIEMFIDFQNKANPKWIPELAAKKWNGGWYGDRKEATKPYWNKVEEVFISLGGNLES